MQYFEEPQKQCGALSLRATALFALAIAYGGGLWFALLHAVEDAHELNELLPTPLAARLVAGPATGAGGDLAGALR